METMGAMDLPEEISATVHLAPSLPMEEAEVPVLVEV